MICFSVYNSQGQILRTGNSPEDMLIYQVKDNEFLISGIYDDSIHYIDTTGEHVAVLMPEKYDSNHVFDYSIKQWHDPRTLTNCKDECWAIVKAKRNQAEFGLFEYNGMIFDGDVDAQRRLNTYISISKSALLNNNEFSANFILANNTVVVLNAIDFVNIELAKANAVAAAFNYAADVRQQIYSATSKEDLDTIMLSIV